jgi:hypothetical protein
MADLVAVPCQECERELAGDSPELRLGLTDDNEPLVYCAECWEREFGGDEPAG